MSICQSSKSVFHTFFFMLQDIDLIFVVSSRDTNGMTPISAQGPLGPRDDIGRGWYGMWYGFCHVLYALSYISTGELYYMNCSLGYLQFYFCLVLKALKELLNYLSKAPGLPYNLRAVVLKIFCLLLHFFVCFEFFIVAVLDVTCIYQTMTSFNKLRHTRMTAPILRTFFS